MQEENKTFDMISATGRAYIALWAERGYLAGLMLGPVLIKLACFMGALALGWQDNMVKLTLILIPALFAEGWMLSHFTRLLVLGQRWPFRPSGDEDADMAELEGRMRGILPGTVCYVLINIILGAVFALAAAYAFPNVDGPISPEDIPPGASLILLAVMAALVICFRLLWLYIPLAVRASGVDFLQDFDGMKNLLSLFGLWLLCSVPAFVAVQIGGSFAVMIVGGPESDFASYIVVILKVIADTLKNLICTAGVVYAWRELSVGKPQ